MSSSPCKESNKTQNKSEVTDEDRDGSSKECRCCSQDKAKAEDFQKSLSYARSISIWLEFLSIGIISAVLIRCTG